MAQIMNFKRMEVNGATKEEALNKAPFDIMGDATQAYKLWRKSMVNGVTEADKKQFMLDYLAKKSKNVAGVGFSITLEAAIVDTRERPCSVKDIKNEKGARKYKTVYRWIDDATGVLVSETDTTKSDAKNAIKEAYANGSYKGNATLVMDKKCVEGQAVVAKAKYTPSKSSRVGSYLVFGVTRD